MLSFSRAPQRIGRARNGDEILALRPPPRGWWRRGRRLRRLEEPSDISHRFRRLSKHPRIRVLKRRHPIKDRILKHLDRQNVAGNQKGHQHDNQITDGKQLSGDGDFSLLSSEQLPLQNSRNRAFRRSKSPADRSLTCAMIRSTGSGSAGVAVPRARRGASGFSAAIRGRTFAAASRTVAAFPPFTAATAACCSSPHARQRIKLDPAVGDRRVTANRLLDLRHNRAALDRALHLIPRHAQRARCGADPALWPPV